MAAAARSRAVASTARPLRTTAWAVRSTSQKILGNKNPAAVLTCSNGAGPCWVHDTGRLRINQAQHSVCPLHLLHHRSVAVLLAGVQHSVQALGCCHGCPLGSRRSRSWRGRWRRWRSGWRRWRAAGSVTATPPAIADSACHRKARRGMDAGCAPSQEALAACLGRRQTSGTSLSARQSLRSGNGGRWSRIA